MTDHPGAQHTRKLSPIALAVALGLATQAVVVTPWAPVSSAEAHSQPCPTPGSGGSGGSGAGGSGGGGYVDQPGCECGVGDGGGGCAGCGK
jgi:hypothetical protein